MACVQGWAEGKAALGSEGEAALGAEKQGAENRGGTPILRWVITVEDGRNSGSFFAPALGDPVPVLLVLVEDLLHP